LIVSFCFVCFVVVGCIWFIFVQGFGVNSLNLVWVFLCLGVRDSIVVRFWRGGCRVVLGWVGG